MLTEAKERVIKTVVVPLIFAGTTGGSIIQTPNVEAGGCNSDSVITSSNISPETLSELEKICQVQAIRNRQEFEAKKRQIQENNQQLKDVSAVVGLLGASFLLSRRLFRKFI